jgi:hypothetical protein
MKKKSKLPFRLLANHWHDERRYVWVRMILRRDSTHIGYLPVRENGNEETKKQTT